MSIESALVTLILMLVAQVPLLVAAWVGYIRSKSAIAENTELTKRGSAAATNSAREAATTAKEAKSVAASTNEAVESMSKKLNGGIDEAINAAVSPLREVLEAHTKKDADDLAELKQKIAETASYVHQRNHDILNALNAHNIKLDVALAKIESVVTGR